MTSLDRVLQCAYALAFVGIAGCSSSSNSVAGNDAGSTGDGGSGGGSCDDYFAAEMAYSARCTGRYDPSRSDDLRTRFETECSASLNASGDTGFANYLGRCAAAMQSATCGTMPPECDLDAVTGGLAVGASCAASTQCQSSYCDFSGSITPSNQSPACGKCAARIQDGQPCGTASTGSIIQCVVQDECDGSTPTKPGTCTPKLAATIALGGACGGSIRANCIAPNFCDIGKTNTCVAPLAEGGTCQVNDECASGLACNRASGAQSGTCISPVALGGSCVLRDCASGLGCDVATSKCVTITYAQAGASCDGDGTRCSHGLCDFSASTTDPPIGKCPAIVADGQSCTPGDQTHQCDDFATCTNNVCALGIGNCP